MIFDGIRGLLGDQIRIGLVVVANVLFVGFSLALNSAAVSADSIQILLPDGKPAAGAKVEWRTVTWEAEKTKTTVRTLQIDAAGRVEMKEVFDEPDRLVGSVLIVDHPDAAIGLWNFGVKDKIKLAPPFKVHGQLVGSDGAPVVEGSVRLIAFGTFTYAGISEGLFRDDPRFMVKADEDGKFQFHGVTLNGYEFSPGGRLLGEGKVNGQRQVGVVTNSLAGDSEFYLNEAHNSPREQEPPIELIVHPLGTVSGTVVNGHDETPAAGVVVVGGGVGYVGRREIKTKADGTFEFANVPTCDRRVFRVGEYSLVEPQEGERQVNVSGLRLPIYPMKVQSSKLINSDAGLPPVIPLDLGYRQEMEVGAGWKLQRSGSWGNTGAEARSKSNGSFEMSLPTGRFVFTVEAPFSNARGAYDWSSEFNLAADEKLPAEISIQRVKGILFKTMLPGDPKINDPIWTTFIVSIKVEGGWTYANKAPLWFVPVKEWGDEVELQVEQRPDGQDRRTLVESIKFTADNKTWPVEIEFPGAVLDK